MLFSPNPFSEPGRHVRAFPWTRSFRQSSSQTLCKEDAGCDCIVGIWQACNPVGCIRSSAQLLVRKDGMCTEPTRHFHTSPTHVQMAKSGLRPGSSTRWTARDAVQGQCEAQVLETH
eukprot:6177536-Pleurochrysis_carterae.AAC.3